MKQHVTHQKQAITKQGDSASDWLPSLTASRNKGEAAERIKEGFLECIKTTPYKKISVSQIVAESGISRKTFYYHFEDKNDLVRWICFQGLESDEFADAVATDGPSAFVGMIRYFISQNRILYGHALQDMSSGSFGQFFSDVMFSTISSRMRQFYMASFGHKSTTNLEIALDTERARLLAITWLLDKREPSADDLFSYLCRSEFVSTQVRSRWIEKMKQAGILAVEHPEPYNQHDYEYNMDHKFTVRESFAQAISNLNNGSIHHERQGIELMLGRYR